MRNLSIEEIAKLKKADYLFYLMCQRLGGEPTLDEYNEVTGLKKTSYFGAIKTLSELGLIRNKEHLEPSLIRNKESEDNVK